MSVLLDILVSASWVCLGTELPLEMVEAIADEIISYKDFLTFHHSNRFLYLGSTRSFAKRISRMTIYPCGKFC
jgi:hypothetical protein